MGNGAVFSPVRGGNLVRAASQDEPPVHQRTAFAPAHPTDRWMSHHRPISGLLRGPEQLALFWQYIPVLSLLLGTHSTCPQPTVAGEFYPSPLVSWRSVGVFSHHLTRLP